MAFVVTEACIKCKYTDCTLCVAECPVEAIVDEEEVSAEQQEFIALNARLSQLWPAITQRKDAPADADQWAGVPAKRKLLDE